ncbi:unnamed protein product [Blepharisma stoltei]|uniref:Uncharacterized protein n=1 Tax=Blepharisma stoltei TaxID=1481888 RepID=A0AAU9J907_9CILI|nr:unnamed protein product [Blepharisma stoltei]
MAKIEDHVINDFILKSISTPPKKRFFNAVTWNDDFLTLNPNKVNQTLQDKWEKESPESPFRGKLKLNIESYKRTFTPNSDRGPSSSSTKKLYSLIAKKAKIPIKAAEISKRELGMINNKYKSVAKLVKNYQKLGVDKSKLMHLKMINLLRDDFQQSRKEMNDKCVITMPISLQTVKQQIRFGTYKFKDF